VGGGERIRLFCALRLPEHVLDAVVGWQERELRVAGGRTVPRPNLHVMLAFLGWRPAADVDGVRSALRRHVETLPPPVFSVERYRETRSVGMLVLSEDAHAARLAYALQEELLGEVERRPWLPHITVLRFGRPPRLRPALPALAPFRTSDAAVYHSVLRSTGAQYEVLESVALGG
jgi:2'-5' RNA ligase